MAHQFLLKSLKEFIISAMLIGSSNSTDGPIILYFNQTNNSMNVHNIISGDCQIGFP